MGDTGASADVRQRLRRSWPDVEPALEGTSGERRRRVLGRLPADLGYEPIAESVAPVVRSRGSRRSRSCYADGRHFVMRALR